MRVVEPKEAAILLAAGAVLRVCQPGCLMFNSEFDYTYHDNQLWRGTTASAYPLSAVREAVFSWKVVREPE